MKIRHSNLQVVGYSQLSRNRGCRGQSIVVMWLLWMRLNTRGYKICLNWKVSQAS